MDFSWTTQQVELHRRARDFAKDHLNEDVVGRVREQRLCRRAWSRAGEFGALGLSVAEADGGMGLDALTTAHTLEGVGQGCRDGGLVFALCAHLFACVMPIAENGSKALKARLLPELISGRAIGANAITEAEAGSDVFALSTRAVQQDDAYVLNGAKSYVSNAPDAAVMVVYAKTAPEHGYLGITAFVVERDRPGLRVGKPFAKLGLSTCATSAVYFDDCRVPISNRLGAEGDGAAIFRDSMAWERSCLFAGYLGVMQRQLDQVVSHARERRQFRKPIGKRQAVAHRIANMKLRLDAARLLLYRACWLRDQEQEATLEVSLSKLAVSEAAIRSALDTIHIHGGSGIALETGIAHDLGDAVPSTIFSGTSEIQRDIIASRLGL